MREAAAKSSVGSGPSELPADSEGKKQLTVGPYWLADLMSGYTVENMSFGPVDSTDLERLLGTGDGGMSTMMGGDMGMGIIPGPGSS